MVVSFTLRFHFNLLVLEVQLGDLGIIYVWYLKDISSSSIGLMVKLILNGSD